MVFQTVTLPAPGFLLHVLYIIVEKNQNGERLTPETRGRTMHGKKETLRFSKKKTGAFASQLGLTPHRDCYKSHGWHHGITKIIAAITAQVTFAYDPSRLYQSLQLFCLGGLTLFPSFSMVLPPRFFHVFTTVFPFSHGFPMIFPWFFHFPMVFLCFSHGFARVFTIIFQGAGPVQRRSG